MNPQMARCKMGILSLCGINLGCHSIRLISLFFCVSEFPGLMKGVKDMTLVIRKIHLSGIGTWLLPLGLVRHWTRNNRRAKPIVHRMPAAFGIVVLAVFFLGCNSRVDEKNVNGGKSGEKPPKYGFEKDSKGWMNEVTGDSRACVGVHQSSVQKKEGGYSLLMDMDLVPGHPTKGKGEAWVDMMKNPPEGDAIPIDLANRTVTAWVYAPDGGEGAQQKPNGFQLLLKDRAYKGEYGFWQNAVPGTWIQVTLDVSDSKPRDGWMERGFDPKHIVAVGIKMAAGEGSKTNYKGPIYVDAINW